MQKPKTSEAVRLLSKEQLLALLGDNVAYSTVWGWMKNEGFPHPLELGPAGGRTTKIAWIESEVIEWIASRPRRKVGARRGRYVAAVLTIALLSPWTTTPAPARDGTSLHGSARAIDGDTVIVNNTVVRLKGVDAPEMRDARGRAARRAMIDIIGDSELTCALTGEKTWRREVGYCTTAAGTDISRAIIEQGWALACARYSTRYVEFETAAAREVQPRAGYCVRR